MSQIDEILKGQDYFYCTRLACKLRVKVCLQRQGKNLDSISFNEIKFPHCVNCTQGVKNKLLQKSGGFMVENLGITREKKEEGKSITPQTENPRLCACGKKTLSPNCPYCPSCMSKKSRTVTGEKENKGDPFKESLKEAKGDIKGLLKAPETPVQIRPGNDILIDFSSHDYILRGIEKLAEEEVRPVGLQIIYILKSYLKSQQTL